MGYMGCAVAALACYTLMMLASYFTGRRYYDIGYPVGNISACFGVAAALCLGRLAPAHGRPSTAVNAVIRALLLVAFCRFLCGSSTLVSKSLMAPLMHFVKR